MHPKTRHGRRVQCPQTSGRSTRPAAPVGERGLHLERRVRQPLAFCPQTVAEGAIIGDGVDGQWLQVLKELTTRLVIRPCTVCTCGQPDLAVGSAVYGLCEVHANRQERETRDAELTVGQKLVLSRNQISGELRPHGTWMQRHGGDGHAGGLVPLVELLREHDVGQFALAVRAPLRVILRPHEAAGAVEVKGLGVGPVARGGGHVDDARGPAALGPPPQCALQQRRESEVAQVVDAELLLKAVLRLLPLRDRHDPGVVHQHRQGPVVAVKRRRTVPHRLQVREVEDQEADVVAARLRLDLFERGLAFGGGPGGDDHPRPPLCQSDGGLLPKPVVAPGDEDGAALQRAVRRREH
mmetsp:Transcript_57543/g.95313  ORF Transcript_57543/g.95313 Transcript_57543/m.95313 type:complete len:353 (+) Transcript_57543:261-1319(+)